VSVRGFDITVAGHFSIDSILLPNNAEPFTVLGGSVTYVSLVTRRLGGSVSVISRVGGDFPAAYFSWLKQEGVDLSNVITDANGLTTSFELQYNHDLSNRKLKLKSKASPVSLNDMPLFLSTKVVHIAPIAGEISYDVAERLKSVAEVLSIDPQGLTRSFDEYGNVANNNSAADKRLLGLADIYKSSQEEINAITGHTNLELAAKAIHDLGVEIVIVTKGAEGAVISMGKGLHTIPAYTSKNVVDPTGAGDVFIGGFLIEYVRQKDPIWCASVGSAAASLVVEGVGPSSFGEKEEIYRRAEEIYEKEIKQ
jgi:sugar/nucleoside kinase (ribokinase family)